MTEWLDFYQKGSFIDIKDSSNIWRVGKIASIDRQEKKASVFFDGYSQNSCLSVELTSSRIAPFRKYSKLYTGQQLVQRDWVFSFSDIIDIADNLTSDQESPFMVTQLLRGHLFTFVECLLTYNYTEYEDLETAVQFFTKVLDFIVMWMKECKSNFHLYYDSLSDPDLFLNNCQAAKVCAWPELLFTLKRLFGLDLRTSQRLVNWKCYPQNYTYCPITANKANTLSYLINYFAGQEGFIVIIELLKEKE